MGSLGWMPRSRCDRWVKLTIAVVLGSACQGEERSPAPADPVHPAVLVGHWIQVYPATGALDTVSLDDDGRVSRSVVGFDLHEVIPHTYWQIGAAVMPGGFCIGEEKPALTHPNPQRHCQGYRLLGDTLWLANQNRTVFVRVPQDGRVLALAPWSSPRRAVSAPGAGDSVARPPANVRVR